MLQSLMLGQARVARWSFIPPLLEPLVSAAESGRDLVPIIQSITRCFGFDTFMFWGEGEDQLPRFAEEVVPAVRAQVAAERGRPSQWTR